MAKAPPGKYKVAKEQKKTKAVHHKRSYKVAKAPHDAKHPTTALAIIVTIGMPSSHHHWVLPALLAVGLGLFHFWH